MKPPDPEPQYSGTHYRLLRTDRADRCLLGAYDECANLCKKTIHEGIYQALNSYLDVCYPLRLSDSKGEMASHPQNAKSSGKQRALKKGTE